MALPSFAMGSHGLLFRSKEELFEIIDSSISLAALRWRDDLDRRRDQILNKFIGLEKKVSSAPALAAKETKESAPVPVQSQPQAVPDKKHVGRKVVNIQVKLQRPLTDDPSVKKAAAAAEAGGKPRESSPEEKRKMDGARVLGFARREKIVVEEEDRWPNDLERRRDQILNKFVGLEKKVSSVPALAAKATKESAPAPPQSQAVPDRKDVGLGGVNVEVKLQRPSSKEAAAEAGGKPWESSPEKRKINGAALPRKGKSYSARGGDGLGRRVEDAEGDCYQRRRRSENGYYSDGRKRNLDHDHGNRNRNFHNDVRSEAHGNHGDRKRNVDHDEGRYGGRFESRGNYGGHKRNMGYGQEEYSRKRRINEEASTTARNPRGIQ